MLTIGSFVLLLACVFGSYIVSGGSFDVLAGFIRRAPRWAQAAGLEWLWRLLMEPRKLWKRYLTTNSEFIWLASREIIARRLGRRPLHKGTSDAGLGRVS